MVGWTLPSALDADVAACVDCDERGALGVLLPDAARDGEATEAADGAAFSIGKTGGTGTASAERA